MLSTVCIVNKPTQISKTINEKKIQSKKINFSNICSKVSGGGGSGAVNSIPSLLSPKISAISSRLNSFSGCIVFTLFILIILFMLTYVLSFLKTSTLERGFIRFLALF